MDQGPSTKKPRTSFFAPPPTTNCRSASARADERRLGAHQRRQEQIDRPTGTAMSVSARTCRPNGASHAGLGGPRP